MKRFVRMTAIVFTLGIAAILFPFFFVSLHLKSKLVELRIFKIGQVATKTSWVRRVQPRG